MELQRSGFFDGDEDSQSLIKRMPMSTKANSFMPRFGGVANGMMEELAYAPTGGNGNSSGMNLLGLKSQGSSRMLKQQPVSTRASDTLKVMFPGDGDITDEGLGDISGIVQEMSNIEDTSFAINVNETAFRLFQ